MADLSAQPPAVSRAVYGAVMGAACIAASAGAGAVTLLLGGDGKSGWLSAASVAAASVVTFLPVLFTGRVPAGGTNFGLLVLAASIARMLGVLTVAMVFDQTRTLAQRPFWLGVLCGAALLLIVETCVAIALLARQSGRGTAAPFPTA